MKSREWSEINRQCLEIFALERAAREGIGAMEASLPAAYERLHTALRPYRVRDGAHADPRCA
jgi:hypothetical protein